MKKVLTMRSFPFPSSLWTADEQCGSAHLNSVTLLLIVLLMISLSAHGSDLPSSPKVKAVDSPVDFVNSYIGTGGGGHEYGGTMPFVSTPFGMTSWTPQTRQNTVGVTSYAYEDNTISGFIGTHQPAIWMGDYGYVTLMPELTSLKISPEDRKQSFSRKSEIATPYYYSVVTDAGNSQHIRTEMTATDHCGIFRFTFPQDSQPFVMIEATRKGITGFVQIDPQRHEIVGYNPDRMDSDLGPLALPHFKGYFVIRFNQSFATYGTYHNSKVTPGKISTTSTNAGAYVGLKPGANDPPEAKIGTSFISIEQARANLQSEIPDWSFGAHRDKLKAIWNQKLGIATIEGATPDQRAIFYTGLYHALLYPKLISEHGRYYSAFDDKVHSGLSYTDYSLWDTYRAENSLLTIFAPERIAGMVQALLQDYQQGGWMPKWPNPSYTNIMVGTPADSVVAEAIAKGFHGFDYQLAYSAVYKDAMTPPDGDTTRLWKDREQHTPYEARAGLTYSKKLGYIPADKTAEAASSTLEEAYEDWDAAQVAKAVGKTQDYRFFIQRSLNYKLLFNSTTGFMQGRNFDGSWASPKAGWTEGDDWVYTWSVLHDVPGLIALMGGPEKFNAKLDQHFNGGHNRHDNEPSHHTGYLYDYSGEPWKTQARVRQIADQYYSNQPDGVAGNEDCGQMSAWFVFTTMGFYPVNPASAEYMIGSPIFTKTTLYLPNGKTFVISAENNSPDNVYIQSARLNAQSLDKPILTYAQIEAGGSLDFVMGATPSTWASRWRPLPLAARR
jgi:predicted alpha-1,2-mannosidase